MAEDVGTQSFTSVILCVTNRLGVNTKRETHGLRAGIIILLHVWAMEDSTRDFLSVEVMVILILMNMKTCGYWTQSQAGWRR